MMEQTVYIRAPPESVLTIMVDSEGNQLPVTYVAEDDPTSARWMPVRRIIIPAEIDVREYDFYEANDNNPGAEVVTADEYHRSMKEVMDRITEEDEMEIEDVNSLSGLVNQPQWPAEIQEVIDNPHWIPRFQWNLTPPAPRDTAPQVWKPPTEGSDGAAILNALIRHCGYEGPRETFESSVEYQNFKREKTDLSLKHRAVKPTAMTVKWGRKKLELYFKKTRTLYRDRKKNHQKCGWKNCWRFFSFAGNCSFHKKNEWDHSILVWHPRWKILGFLFHQIIPQENRPVSTKWFSKTSVFAKMLYRCRLTVEKFDVLKWWKEVVNGSSNPVLRHSIKLGLVILTLIHNATVTEVSRIEFAHYGFDVSKASLPHVLKFLEDNGVKFKKSHCDKKSDPSFLIQSQYPIPNVYLAPLTPGLVYAGVNGSTQSKLNPTAINRHHKAVTKVSQSFATVDCPEGVRIWQPSPTQQQEKQLRSIKNKKKSTQEQKYVWKILLEEANVVESLLHVAIIIGEMFGCLIDRFPLRRANDLVGTGHDYKQEHLEIMRLFFEYLTEERLEIIYTPNPTTVQLPQWPMTIVWSAFDELINSSVVEYDV